ncbi:MAG: hypothetical protein JW725_04650 [Candidatus Babeliaceae bacterium]|nr:hypothetical protein [Candidatus Babeliaceae bacterium]
MQKFLKLLGLLFSFIFIFPITAVESPKKKLKEIVNHNKICRELEAYLREVKKRNIKAYKNLLKNHLEKELKISEQKALWLIQSFKGLKTPPSTYKECIEKFKREDSFLGLIFQTLHQTATQIHIDSHQDWQIYAAVFDPFFSDLALLTGKKKQHKDSIVKIFKKTFETYCTFNNSSKLSLEEIAKKILGTDGGKEVKIPLFLSALNQIMHNYLKGINTEENYFRFISLTNTPDQKRNEKTDSPNISIKDLQKTLSIEDLKTSNTINLFVIKCFLEYYNNCMKKRLLASSDVKKNFFDKFLIPTSNYAHKETIESYMESIFLDLYHESPDSVRNKKRVAERLYEESDYLKRQCQGDFEITLNKISSKPKNLICSYI